MAKMYTFLTLLASTLLITACGAKSKGDSAATESVLPNATSTPQALVAAASSATVLTNGKVTFSVIGGTGPYTWSIQTGGGTLSTTTGATIEYTAGSNATLAQLGVSDAVGNQTTASVQIVVSGSTDNTNTSSSNVCSGNYSATLGSYSAAFQFTTSGTTLSGALVYAGHNYPLQGTCSSSGISFILTETGDSFSGSFVANGNNARSKMQGTYLNAYYHSTQTWTATPQ